ncbi:hypothetical protein MPQ_1189 [Methylovorus sp. MP688]|nr:hypothetical protein MPQ_1189 [Methylovorus sp. MP688]
MAIAGRQLQERIYPKHKLFAIHGLMEKSIFNTYFRVINPVFMLMAIALIRVSRLGMQLNI